MMKDRLTLIKLYYLITMADGVMNDKEVEVGKKIMTYYGLNEQFFYENLQILTKHATEKMYLECISELKKIPVVKQVEYLAWIGLVANADGFMDKKEWELLYKLYNKELQLNLQDIINKQRELVPYLSKPTQGIK